MNDVHLLRLAADQHRCLSVRQLHEFGYSDEMIEQRARTGWLAAVGDGGYSVGPPGNDLRVRWMAATLSAPETVLGMESAGAAYGVLDRPVPLITVIRPGSGG